MQDRPGSRNPITWSLCGFRRQRSTLDHLTGLETYIRNAFIKNQHVVDLDKAHDTTWKHGSLKDLYDMGLRGHLPEFISNFLQDRHFQVRVGSALLDRHEKEMGIPQGSILSVTRFSIKINSIAKDLQNDIDGSLFVNDLSISYRAKHMANIERKLQLCLNWMHKMSLETRFKFSKSKTQCMHFCQMRKMHNDPDLYLNGTPIKVVT